MANGWITLHRKILDSTIWDTDEPFDMRSAWIDLLLMAYYEDRQFILKDKKTIIIHRGQAFVSARYLASRWHWSKDRVTRYIKMLKNLGMITTDATQSGTLLTVEKYAFFQDVRDTRKDADKDTVNDTVEDADKDKNNNINNINKGNKEKEDAASFPGGNY